jgi:predicted amidohydrolase
VLRVPADERRCSKGLKDSCELAEAGPGGPSKFAGFRREICLLTRSRVLGIMNVAFRIFFNTSRLVGFLRRRR